MPVNFRHAALKGDRQPDIIGAGGIGGVQHRTLCHKLHLLRGGLIKQGFSGWKDEQSYNELSGSLLAIRKNIDKYYPAEINRTQNDNDKEEQEMPQKSPKVFISHSSQDKDYVSCIVDFLEDIGLTQEQLFCSSIPGYGIPLDEDIYDYLKQQFQEHNLHVILVLSDNYYQSVACMNEMGAA